MTEPGTRYKGTVYLIDHARALLAQISSDAASIHGHNPPHEDR